MTKTTCDICGKEMPISKFKITIEEMNFCVSSYGRIWDICLECRESLNRWMTIRKSNSAEVYNLFQQAMCENGIVINKNLCDTCKTKGCIFQSGIVRSHCEFYKEESEE